ncbi:MAG TPA: hypothetical protein VGE45_18650 [Chloroflexia bacterium]|jgi:hypothetical protein
MATQTISELVQVQSGYTSYVDLRFELFDDNKNIGRMSQYRPITSHRLAFQKLARSLNPKDRRVYLVTGSYGTGKSHLSLMLANYMQTPAGEAPMPDFFKNFAEVELPLSEELRAKRPHGRYLVALCDWGARADFEEVVLRAVDDALKREGFTETLETPYLFAERKLAEWKGLVDQGDPRGQFYSDFERELIDRNPGTTLSAFIKSLKGFDPTVLEEFKRIHQHVTTAPFTYDKSDLVAILESTLASAAFKERFLGLLVLFDEFGDTMDKGYLSPKAFQKFAQLCADTPPNCARLVFVGTAHKDLTAYARAYNTTDFRTASDRIESVPLTPDGIEDIIAAIVVPQKESTLWKEKIVPKSAIFDSLLNDCNRLKLFDWLTGPRIRKAIIENIYPMHPMATYALLQLARDVASNNRSIFTFFSNEIGQDADPGSYGHYVATTPIEMNGKLNLYTADNLWDFFGVTLNSDNRELRDTVRGQIKDYEASVRELKRLAMQDSSSRMLFENDLLIMRILRLMLIYNVIQIPNSKENLQFGLYMTTQSEITELHNRLQSLTKKGILYNVKEIGVYEFKQSTSIDLERVVEDYVKSAENLPGNIVAELNELVPLDKKGEQYMDAKDYNLPFGEDKRLERRLVRAVDLLSEVDTPFGKRSYFEALESEIDQETAKRGEFEGIALHVACESAEDIQKARNACARNVSQRVVVAIPKQPIGFLDAVLDLRALLHIDQNTDAMKLTVQDKAILHDRLNGDGTRPGARDTLRSRRDKLLNSKEIKWYGQYAQLLPTDTNKVHDAANQVMVLMYTPFRNQFVHDDFNKIRVRDLTKNQSLKEAVEKLLDYTEPITIDASFPQQRGDIKYLRKCLLNNGALDQSKKAEGSKLRCEVSAMTTPYEAKLPSLAAMVHEVQNLGMGDRLKIRDWAAKYRRAPYGQGPVSLAISLAYLVRVFGDSIRFKAEEGAVADLMVNSFDMLLNLIDGQQYPNAFLSYRQLRSEEKELIKAVYTLFGEPASAVAREYTMVEAYNAIRVWWSDLPPIARVPALYPKAGYPHAVDFIGALQKIEARDPYFFLFDELPSAYGAEASMIITKDQVSAIAEQLPEDKSALESALSIVENQIVTALRTMFGVAGNTYEDILESVRVWYNSLDAIQQDTHASWQDRSSIPLVQYLKTMSTIEDTFLNKIPASPEYGMKAVQDWIADRVAEYVSRLERGKALIDDNRLKVEVPRISVDGKPHALIPDGETVKFKGQITLTFQHADPDTRIYVAEGGADPTDATSPRREVNGTEPLNILDNKVLRVAAQDVEGNWSRAHTVRLINEHEQYLVKLPEQQALPGYGDTVTFIFPPDAESFEATLQSLLTLGVERGLFSWEQLTRRLNDISDKLPREQ